MKRIVIALFLTFICYPMLAQEESGLRYEGSVSTFMYLDRSTVYDASSGFSIHTSHGVRLLNDYLYVGGSFEYIYEKYQSLSYSGHLKFSYPSHSTIAGFLGCELGGRTYFFSMDTDLIITPSAGISLRLKDKKALEFSTRATFDMYHTTPIYGFGLTFVF